MGRTTTSVAAEGSGSYSARTRVISEVYSGLRNRHGVSWDVLKLYEVSKESAQDDPQSRF